ncbi:MAG: PAS domain-containing protein, partial [Spirochaetota bacterium]
SITESRRWRRAYYFLFAAGTGAYWIFADTPALRVGISSAAVLSLFFPAAVELIRTSALSKLRKLLGILCGVYSLFMIFRAVMGFMHSGGISLMSPGMIQYLSFISAYLLLMFLGIGFILMLKEQKDRLLAESEEKYRTLVEKAQEMIGIVQNERFVFMNPLMKEALCIRGEPDDFFLSDILHPDDRDMVVNNYQRRVSGDDIPSGYDFRIRSLDGKDTWVSISATRIQWKGGFAVMCLLVNINERKNMEKEREHIICDLQKALSEVKTLSGMLPICASCKKIRDDQGYWNQIEVYIQEHSDVDFSHSLCPECAQKLYPELHTKDNGI